MNRKQRRQKEKEERLKAKRASKRIDYETTVLLSEEMVKEYGVEGCIDRGFGLRETRRVNN